MTEVSSWSSTAASNNSAAPNGFPEGMAPSGVNDAAREVMAAVHKFYERTSPSVASTGSANAYVVAYSVAPSAYVTKEIYSWVANFANTGACTANVNSLGAKSIKMPNGADPPANTIVNGQPVLTVYDGTNLVLISLPGWTITTQALALLDDSTAADQRTTMGAAASGANTDLTSVYLNNTGLKVKDTNASHGLTFKPGSDLTADRVLTVTTGDADRTLTLSGDATVSGSNTGDQTITLTGDVTGSGTGTFAATIANDAVTYAKMQNVSATDKVLGRSSSGAGDVEEITCTAAGRAILDDADAAAQRTTLGAAALASAQTFSGGQRATITTLTDDTTITPDLSASNDFTVTLGGNRTLANPTNITAGQSGVIYVVQDGTGSRTLTWGSYWDFEGGTAPVLSTAAGSVDVIAYSVRTTTSIVAILAIKGAA